MQGSCFLPAICSQIQWYLLPLRASHLEMRDSTWLHSLFCAGCGRKIKYKIYLSLSIQPDTLFILHSSVSSRTLTILLAWYFLRKFILGSVNTSACCLFVYCSLYVPNSSSFFSSFCFAGQLLLKVQKKRNLGLVLSIKYEC